MENERLPLELRRDGAGAAMSTVGLPLPAAWTSRAHPVPAAPARHFAIAGRGLLILGITGAVLIWLISVGILVHDLVSWWAEFAVFPLQATASGFPPGW